MPYNQISWIQEKFLNVVDLIFFLIFRSWLIKDAWHQCGVYCNTKSGGKTIYAQILHLCQHPYLYTTGYSLLLIVGRSGNPASINHVPQNSCCWIRSGKEWPESFELAIAALAESVQNGGENVVTFMWSEGKRANHRICSSFLTLLRTKIDLYKLCCNLFAAKAKFH